MFDKTPAPAAFAPSEYKIAEAHKDDDGNVTHIVLQLDDGRMVGAAVAKDLQIKAKDILKSSVAVVKDDGEKDGVPVNPIVTSVL